MLFTLLLSIWIIGDSQAAYFSKSTKYTKSIVSSRIEQWNKKYIYTIPFQYNDVVFIFLGSNHYDDRYIPEMNNIKNIIVEKNLKCFWIGPPIIRNKKWNNEKILKNKVNEFCQYISSQDILITSKDKIHPNKGDQIKWKLMIDSHIEH